MKISDEWQTPQRLFDELNQEFNFDIDLYTTKENSKCELYCNDYLSNFLKLPDSIYNHDLREYMNNFTWFMNPPYSNPKPFIEKAWEDSQYCRIVCLIKCDPSMSMWNIFYNFRTCPEECAKTLTGLDECYYCGSKLLNGPKPGCEIRLINKRIQFDPTKEMNAEKIDNNWWIECKHCLIASKIKDEIKVHMQRHATDYCTKCKQQGKIKLSSPSFPGCLLIFDRRAL